MMAKFEMTHIILQNETTARTFKAVDVVTMIMRMITNPLQPVLAKELYTIYR